MNKITKNKMKKVSNKKLKNLHSKNKKRGAGGEGTPAGNGRIGESETAPPPIPNVPTTFFGKELSQEQLDNIVKLFQGAHQDWNSGLGNGGLPKVRMKSYFKKLIENLKIQQNKYTKLNSIINKGKSANEIKGSIFQEAKGPAANAPGSPATGPETAANASPGSHQETNASKKKAATPTATASGPETAATTANAPKSSAQGNSSANASATPASGPQVPRSPATGNTSTGTNTKLINATQINDKVQEIISKLIQNLSSSQSQIQINDNTPEDILNSINDANLLGDFNQQLYKFFNTQFSGNNKTLQKIPIMIDNKFNQLLYTQVVNGKIGLPHPTETQKAHLEESLKAYTPANAANPTNGSANPANAATPANGNGSAATPAEGGKRNMIKKNKKKLIKKK